MANIVKKIRFTLQGNKADMGKLGSLFGMNGITPHARNFCTDFNAKTKDKDGKKLRVKLFIYDDKTISYEIHCESMTDLLLKAVNKEKGSSKPNIEKIGSITMDKVKEIGSYKLSDLNANSIEAAMQTVIGCAKSLGIVVEG